MKSMTKPGSPAAVAAPAPNVTLDNRMPPKHPQRVALETAIRNTLAEFEGNWDVILEVPDGLSLAVSVVAPDGSAWTMSCCNPAHRDPDSVAETVRAACSRRRWLDPGVDGANGKGGAGGHRA
jgi:hypothetical protein